MASERVATRGDDTRHVARDRPKVPDIGPTTVHADFHTDPAQWELDDGARIRDPISHCLVVLGSILGCRANLMDAREFGIPHFVDTVRSSPHPGEPGAFIGRICT